MRFKQGQTAYFIGAEGQVESRRLCRRFGSQWWTTTADVGPHEIDHYRDMMIPTRELFGDWADAENYAVVVRQWIAEEEAIAEGGATNG